MSDSRESLLAALAELDKKELGAEALRSIARLHEIRAEAAKLIVTVNDNPKTDVAAAFQKAANLAEEACHLGVRLTELRNV